MTTEKTYIQELMEKESSYGKIFKVSGPRKDWFMKLSSLKGWEDPRCMSWSRLVTTNLSEKSSNSTETMPSSSATRIHVVLLSSSRTHCW